MLPRFVCLILLVIVPAWASAQALPIPIPTISAPASNSPFGVPVKRVGNLDTAPVIFQGQHLFTIAAPAADPNYAGIPPIVQRIDTIQENMRRIVPISTGAGYMNLGDSPFEAKTFTVAIGNEGGYSTLYATDGRKKDALPIMTLTESDATLYGQPAAQLAASWRDVLQTALGPAVLSLEPEYFRAQVRKVPFVLIGAGLATWFMGLLRIYLRKRATKVDAAVSAIDAQGTSSAPEAKRLRVGDTFISGTLWFLSWATLGLWVLVGLWLLTVFPGTRAYANELSGKIARIVGLWLGIAALDRFISLLIVRVSNAWEINPFLSFEQRGRLVLRRPTVVRALENLKFIVLYAIAIGTTFSILSISTQSVLTIGAVIAFAISFAAQSIIKDYVNGFLILAEDQFAINDIVTINGTNGTVENLTLRMTQIRTDDGRLVTIANNTISVVENATRAWSRIDFRVSIANTSDIGKASALLQKILDGAAQQPEWRDIVLEAPEVLGVDSVSNAGIVLRAWIKTTPAGRPALAREINRLVDEGFRTNAIDIAIPQTMMVAPAVVK